MTYKQKHLAKDVFTPTKPARATFIEREPINDKLVNALATPGKQLVIYGHSGSGKTTLLENKLYQIYEHHITTRCYSGLSFDQLILDAFDQLRPFYESERSHAKKSDISPTIEYQYLGIKAQIGAKINKEAQSKHQRLLPPQLTPRALASFLGESHSCWVLEDFHKIDSSEKVKLAQVMKMFMDMSDRYDDLKIIAIGAVDTARQVVEYDPEMRNRVSEIYVPLMTDVELRQIIERGEQLLNFSIPHNIKRNIVKYSNGLASVCHQLCLNICFAADIHESLSKHVIIDDSVLEAAVLQYLDDTSDTIKSAFDRAFRQFRKRKFDNGKLILESLLKYHQDGATHAEILEKIRHNNPAYPTGNLTAYLKQLTTNDRGAIIRYDSYSGKYSFTDPSYRAFAMTLLESQNLNDQHLALPEIQIDSKNLDKLFREVYLTLSLADMVVRKK